MKSSNKIIAIMAAILVLLLLTAVVLLSVIILSFRNEGDDETNPPVTTSSVVTTTDGSSVTTTSSIDPFSTFTANTTTSNDPVTQLTTTTARIDPDIPTTTTTTSSIVTSGITGNPGEIGETVEIKNDDGSVVRMGSFTSSNDYKLKLYVEWEAYYESEDSTTVMLTVRVFVQSYSLQVSARSRNTLTIGSQETSFTSPAISVTESKLTYTQIASRTVTISKSSTVERSVDIDVAWNFDGTYSGKAIEWLTVSGTIAL